MFFLEWAVLSATNSVPVIIGRQKKRERCPTLPRLFPGSSSSPSCNGDRDTEIATVQWYEGRWPTK